MPNPSVPRSPRTYEGSERCNLSENEHTPACGQALRNAVELVPDALREMAAASAWYGFRFIQDVVSLFGRLIKNVCIISECVAVVQLKRAPFSGAVAWAGFSGAGIYTLQVQRRDVKAITYSGYNHRAGPISESAYIKPLQEDGWRLKRERPVA